MATRRAAPSVRDARSDATRSRLLASAARLFGTRGYADTSLEEVVRRARVTKGALYHHFVDKRALFEAVFEEEERKLMDAAVAAATPGRDAWQRLRAGCHAFLRACLAPAVQRIVLVDAPAVLGWDRWRELDARYALALLESAVADAMATRPAARRSAKVLAHLLMAAVTEAAMLLARADEPSGALARVTVELDALLDGLRAPGRAGK